MGEESRQKRISETEGKEGRWKEGFAVNETGMSKEEGRLGKIYKRKRYGERQKCRGG